MKRPDNGFMMDVSHLQTPDLVVLDGHRIGLQEFVPIYHDDPKRETLLACEIIDPESISSS